MNEEEDVTRASDQENAEIARIAQALDEWHALLGRQFGPLSRPQRRALLLLSEETPMRVGDLGERLGVTTAGTTRMLDKLEALGYATRSRTSPTDQRQVYVTLTPAGSVALSEAEGVFLRRIQASLASLSPTERSTLARLLGSLVAHQPQVDRAFGRDTDTD